MVGQRVRYENTEAYLVNFLGGASGSFIATMIFLFSVEGRYDAMFSSNASAFQAWSESESNAMLIDTEDSYYANYVALEPVYWHLKPVSLHKPYILIDHLYPDWEDLFDLLPRAKNVIVTMDHDDAELIVGNLFYKTFVDNYRVRFWAELWKTWKNDYDYFREYDNILSVPHEVITNHILSAASTYNIEQKYLTGYHIPEEYSGRVYTISIKEIMNEPDKVLSVLAAMTGKAVNPNIKQGYTNYLLKQKAFIQEKMPWLVDKYCINI